MIQDIKAMQIFDSRGNPTLEVSVKTEHGTFSAAVPSGASTGVHEALELRDGLKAYGGAGVSKAILNIKKIKKVLLGKDETDQKLIDTTMLSLDGTENKSVLGANAILGVSMAVCRAGAATKGIPLWKHIAMLAGKRPRKVLPTPYFNVINGGKHAGNALPFQEFMIAPVKAKNFEEAMKMSSETYHELKKIIKTKYGIDATNVGDEGGFAPNVSGAKEALDLLVAAISAAKYTGKIKIAMDCAAAEMFEDGSYNLNFKGKTKKMLSGEKLLKEYENLASKYPIISIEDPFDQDDFDHHALLTKKLKKVQIVGDDLLVTNPKRIALGIEKKACNALLLKVNQIGSVSEAIQACLDAQAVNWNVMVSHRSGETEDSFIADLVVGLQTGQIKSGAPCRSERLAKYNQLLRIEQL
ncbi:MAG: phosphopyruvate hydratase [Candidatus Woesearchaeota archaeon]